MAQKEQARMDSLFFRRALLQLFYSNATIGSPRHWSKQLRLTSQPHSFYILDSAVLWFYGFTVLRFCGFTVLRFYGFAVLRFCGFAVLRFYGFTVLWFPPSGPAPLTPPFSWTSHFTFTHSLMRALRKIKALSDVRSITIGFSIETRHLLIARRLTTFFGLFQHFS